MVKLTYTYAVPTVNGEPIVKIKISKRENVSDYKIYPDKHVFTTTKYHVELKEFLIRRD